MVKYDFAGWATRNNLLCSDGRIIRKDAFLHNDGQIVPLVWNHQHNDPNEVLGHALLKNMDDGVYAYCTFNETESGKTAKLLVQHGDISSLSIYANKLKQQGPNVIHGSIREVSLVLASANPGASIESVIKHGEESDEEAIIYTGEELNLYHADEDTTDKKEDNKMAEDVKKTADGANDSENDMTIQEVVDTMNEDQKNALYYLVGEALDNVDDEDEDYEEEDDEDYEGDDEDMKHNVFDQDEMEMGTALSHADGATIVELAKKNGVGSLREAINIFAEEYSDTLQHGFETDALTALMPDYKNLTPGAPEILRPDQSWVMAVINKIHKSPYSRVRTRQADARIAELKAKGYQKKGDQKMLTNHIKLIGRSFDPQTIYIKDMVHRDDIIDITDFDYVAYVWNLMKDNMYETLALAALVGDGRDEADADKIHENHVRSIYNDDELYTIHRTVDLEKAKTEIQGSNTGANFSENYIYAEAILMESLYAREKFKGSGTPDFYCTPHLINVMLLARDLNGRRIYDSKADLAKALNVGAIHEIEQFEGVTRTTDDGDKKKLLGLFVNLADYQFGSTKGGEVTKFDDFDIDFNTHKYLMETRLSGALTKLYSAIALELDDESAAG